MTPAERIAAVERVLDERGAVVLRPTLFPGATEAATEAALTNFYEVVTDLGLTVERLSDSTRIAYRPETDEAVLENLRRTASAGSN